jgi:hypothetical protein
MRPAGPVIALNHATRWGELGPPGIIRARNARGALTYRDHEKLAQGLPSSHLKPFFRPDLALSLLPRADAVKVGRRASRAANSDSPGRTWTVASTAARLRPVGGEADLDRLFAAAPVGSYATPRRRSQFGFPCSLQRTESATGKSVR